MDEQKSNEHRFSELLPFYVNRTLETDDVLWIESYIADHPETQKQIAFESLMHETAHLVRSAKPETERFNKLLQAMHQVHPRDHWFKKWLSQLTHWIAFNRIAIPVPVLAAAAFIVLGQTIFTIGSIPNDPEANAYRGASVPCTKEPQLRVVFGPDARHADVLLLLRKVEATFNSGPSENGEVWISVPSSRSIEEVKVIFQKSPLVEDVIVSKTRPKNIKCNP